MKVFGIHLPFTEVKNVSKMTPEVADLLQWIQSPQQQIHRTRQEITDFKNALMMAENTYNPNRYLLIKLYKDVILDAHLSACIDQRKNLTLTKKFKVVDKDGEEIEKLTDILEAKWFHDFIDMSLDSKFWGYSLIQFDDLINDSFKCVELVPRIYVKPEKHIVVKNWSDIDGVDYLAKPYSDWCIGVGNPTDLGLLMKASPLMIWKKNALGAWADYQQKFGSPYVIGRTDATDKQTQDKMDAMLANMSSAPWGRFGKNDSIELMEVSSSDSSKVFDDLIERVNSELSKLILGQTGTTAEKSFVGSAEVHERVLNNYAETDEHFIENVCNTQLIPMLENLGIKFNGAKIEVDDAQELSQIDQITIDSELLKYYTIKPEQILESYGRDVEVKETPDSSIQDVQNKLNILYK